MDGSVMIYARRSFEVTYQLVSDQPYTPQIASAPLLAVPPPR